MVSTALYTVAENVVRRAQRQGFVVPTDVREEMAQAGYSGEQWKDVLTLARPSLALRGGRYYFVPAVSVRKRQEERQQRAIGKSIRKLVRHYRAAADRVERREHDRHDFIQPVTVVAEDGKEHRLLSRDVSPSGIRLIGNRRLLGQKVHILVADPEGGAPARFLARILWTCQVGDDLFENGGRFLEIEPARLESADSSRAR